MHVPCEASDLDGVGANSRAGEAGVACRLERAPLND